MDTKLYLFRDFSDQDMHWHHERLAFKMLPDELQVGWEFEERATGEKRFVHWGSTKNRQTLARLIDDVEEKHGITEVVELSS